MDTKTAVKFFVVNWNDDTSTLERSNKEVAEKFAAGKPVYQQNKNTMWKGIIESVWGSYIFKFYLKARNHFVWSNFQFCSQIVYSPINK